MLIIYTADLQSQTY